MKELERQYRGSLRWYSKKWRTQHGEVLLDTLLACAEADGRTRPTHREKINLASRGIHQRVVAAAPFAMFTAAFVGLLSTVSLLGVSPGNKIMFRLPTIPAPGVGELYSAITTPSIQTFWFELAGLFVFILGAVLGLVLLRRNRSLLNVPVTKSTRAV